MKSRKTRFHNIALIITLLTTISIMPAARTLAQQEQQQPEPSVQMRQDFSDDELQSFIKANEHVIAIQKEGEQNMVKAIEEQGLTVDRFHEILEQQRDPQRTTTDSTTSAEEMSSFNNAAQVILKENERLEKEMSARIQEEGIDLETYKQIMIAYQQNPDVQNRVNKMAGQEQAPDQQQAPEEAEPQDQTQPLDQPQSQPQEPAPGIEPAPAPGQGAEPQR